MSDLQPTASNTNIPSDLPAHIVSLARMIARDCAAPGKYTVELVMPQYPTEPMEVEIRQSNTIRDVDVARQ